MDANLSSLLDKNLIWQGCESPSPNEETVNTGFHELDSVLNGGWPTKGLIAVKSPVGIGELRLFLPGLRNRYLQSNELLVFISPPFPINAEMLIEQGFDPHNILIIQPQKQSDSLWSAEQCLISGCCFAVIIWPEHINAKQMKRLQLACLKGGSIAILFKITAHNANISASLSLVLSAAEEGINVEILKRRGGWPLPPMTINMQSQWPLLTHQEKVRHIEISYKQVNV